MTPLGAWRLAAIGLGLAIPAGANRHLARGVSSTLDLRRAEISPKLTPKSDSHFFGHDYPDDFKPTAPLEKDFDHPYPVVQDTDAYDADFVKDENSDNGEWKAQMDYDHLRTRMEKLKADEKRITKNKEELEKALEAEKAKKKQVDEELRKSDEEHQKLEKEAEMELERAKEAKSQNRPANATEASEESQSNSSTSVGVVDASKKVQKELDDIEECKKRLAEAQAKLKKLHEEVKQAETKDRQAHEAQEAAEKEAADLGAKESDAKSKLKEARDGHERALSTYRKERQELEDTEGQLQRAEAQLRKFRGEPPPQARSRAAARCAVGISLALALLPARLAAP